MDSVFFLLNEKTLYCVELDKFYHQYEQLSLVFSLEILKCFIAYNVPLLTSVSFLSINAHIVHSVCKLAYPH